MLEEIFEDGRPQRTSSRKANTPPSRKRFLHLQAVFTLTPNWAATTGVPSPRAQPSTIFAFVVTPEGRLRDRAIASNSWRSVSWSVIPLYWTLSGHPAAYAALTVYSSYFRDTTLVASFAVAGTQIDEPLGIFGGVCVALVGEVATAGEVDLVMFRAGIAQAAGGAHVAHGVSTAADAARIGFAAVHDASIVEAGVVGLEFAGHSA